MKPNKLFKISFLSLSVFPSVLFLTTSCNKNNNKEIKSSSFTLTNNIKPFNYPENPDNQIWACHNTPVYEWVFDNATGYNAKGFNYHLKFKDNIEKIEGLSDNEYIINGNELYIEFDEINGFALVGWDGYSLHYEKINLTILLYTPRQLQREITFYDHTNYQVISNPYKHYVVPSYIPSPGGSTGWLDGTLTTINVNYNPNITWSYDTYKGE